MAVRVYGRHLQARAGLDVLGSGQRREQQGSGEARSVWDLWNQPRSLGKPVKSRKAGGVPRSWRDGCEAVVRPGLLREGGRGQPQSWSARREGTGRTLTFIYFFVCLISRQNVTNRKEVGGKVVEAAGVDRLCFLSFCSSLEA